MRAHSARMWAPPRGALLPLVLAAATLGGCDQLLTVDPQGPGGCVSTEAFFNDQVWPRVLSRCATCHVAGGAAGGTRFVLQPDSRERSLAVVTEVGRTLMDNGMPLLLRKPSGQLPHGGGALFPEGSAELGLLKDLLAQLEHPVVCTGPDAPVPPPRSASEGVQLLEPAGALRKAALQLVGRIPTEAELAAARTGGLDALDGLLLQMMTEPAFLERVKEIFNDVLLTDANLFDRTYDSVVSKGISPALFPSRSWYGSPDTDVGRLTINAVAREPLELVANVVRKDRPLHEIVTARYRMVNPSSARVFGVTPTFQRGGDLSEFVEVQIPAMHDYAPGQGEYAGVLTTTSFLYRYPNTETNRNRKRARYFYRYFLGYDIMKAAQRLDLSTVDFSANPWLTNAACTGCHAAIDPVAGAFQNWTNCYSGMPVRYYRPGERYCQGSWYPLTTMFPPGVAAGGAGTLPQASLPRALEALAATVVGHPGFARAMTEHVFTGLMGRPLLAAPTDAQAIGFASLTAAYEGQQAVLKDLAGQFAKSNFSLKRLVIAVVKSAPFRAVGADQDNRLELSGMGGGALTPPEVLHRKIASIVGAPWGTAGALRNTGTLSSPFYLLGTDKLRVLYGGIDSLDVTTRQSLPGGLAAAASQRMAYEMACEYVAADLSAPRAARRLFPLVDRDRAPTGDPAGPGQADILRSLQYLHARFLGETLDLASAELRQSYDLLTALYKDGGQAIAAGKLGKQLSPRCRGDRFYATGDPVAGWSADDPSYVVRAWQGLIAYLLMDYKFLFE